MRVRTGTALVALIAGAALVGSHSLPLGASEVDTVFVRSSGNPPPVTITAAQVLWRSDELENPTAMALVGSSLVVADRTRIHLVPTDGSPARTIGRGGDGPGEFRSISSVSGLPGDSILVYDTRLRRLSYFSPEGAFVRSAQVPAMPPFLNPSRDGEGLVASGDALLGVWSELVRPGSTSRKAVLAHEPSTGRTRELHVWPSETWRDYGSFTGTKVVFDFGAIIAISPTGVVAHGDGRDYCISLHDSGSERVTRVCRAERRTRLARTLRTPDLSIVGDPSLREALRVLVRDQEYPTHLPAFDRLLFARDGSLWLRTLGPELARVHPQVLNARPEMGPSSRRWDVLGGDGALVGAFVLPAAFAPKVITAARVYGFLTLRTGEVTIAWTPTSG